jgi:HAD superfamily hydrolase (TIGR01549 family)
MAIKSKSEFLSYRVFIFDLDNTIYNEEEYLFQGYAAIARFLAGVSGVINEEVFFQELKNIFLMEGRSRLFDKVVKKFHLDHSLVSDCIRILHTFEITDKLKINLKIKLLLAELKRADKYIFILTNGNPTQQKNKVKNIEWGELIDYFQVLYANELKPKPSSDGVEKILMMTAGKKSEVVLIGDSETDRLCAENSGIVYVDVTELSGEGLF